MTRGDKILVLGKGGQVGSALTRLFGARCIAADQEQVDFLDPDFIPKLEQWLGGQPLSAVINAAAYTNVDKAEGEGCEAAFRINAGAVGELAAWCKKLKVPLIHYSTDYVFDGSGNHPRREDEAPRPLNAYGQSKLAGEEAIRAQGGEYIIFRTSWVYDAHGKNFFNTILRLMKEKESLNVICDQAGAPTYAPHLARATVQALCVTNVKDRKRNGNNSFDICPLAFGIYHLVNSGETSWHSFAQAIFTLAKARDSSIKCRRINPVPTDAYPLPAPRPLNSRLDCTKARNLLGLALPSWEMGLKECIEEKYAGSGVRDKRVENHSAKNTGG